MIEEFTFLISGIIFGLTLGMSPGPLLTLVISETLKHDKKEGIKIAVAPILTDLPIVLITLLILSKLTNFDPILGSISILGAIFIGYLAYCGYNDSEFWEIDYLCCLCFVGFKYFVQCFVVLNECFYTFFEGGLPFFADSFVEWYEEVQ